MCSVSLVRVHIYEGQSPMALVKVYTALHNREGVNMFVWPGNSADLNPIEEVWNIMKKKSGKLPNNKIR